MAPAGEEQRFDFDVGDDDDRRPPRRYETPEELIARVEAVHAAASRTRSRRSHVADVADEYLAAYPLDALVDQTDPIVKAEGTVLYDVVGSLDEIGLDQAEEELVESGAESLTISGFYERVRHALSGAFPEEVWVTGEIRSLRESRGHRYIELADAGAETTTGRGAGQQLEVVCWARDWPPIGRQLAEAGVELEVGRVVRVRGKVSVWEGGSKLRFTLTALDIEALLGGIAAARRRLLLALEAEGLLHRNAQLVVPLVPLRIGLVTSPGSEAHRDFVGQLERSGFAFEIHLEPSLVQGPDAPARLVAALDRLGGFGPDLAVVVRGGGGRGDLAAFDSEEVARAVAHAHFPVWAGIGHTGDRSVVDEVVHSSWITPTACGEAVAGRVAVYWDTIAGGARALSAVVASRLDLQAERLATVEQGLARSARHQLDRRSAELAGARLMARRCVVARLRAEGQRTARRAGTVSGIARRALSTEAADLTRYAQVIAAFDPGRQFARGWSLTHRDGRLVRSVAELSVGDTVITRLDDGEATSTITKTVPDRSPSEHGSPT